MSLYGLAVIPIRYLVAAAATGLALSPGTADASLLIDRWTSRESLKVDSAGRAQITWWVGGRKRTVVVDGRTVRYNATLKGRARGVRIRPAEVPRARVQIQLENGWKFALQKVRRRGQFGDVGPLELRFARWTGAPTELDVTGEWAYAGRFPRICGTARFHGEPFFGYKHTLTGNPLDEWGRNVYIDVRRANGWYRIMGVLTRPRGYALLIRKGFWRGDRYRATVVGPNLGRQLAPDAIELAPMPARGTTGACPFPTETYEGQ